MTSLTATHQCYFSMISKYVTAPLTQCSTESAHKQAAASLTVRLNTSATWGLISLNITQCEI